MKSRSGFTLVEMLIVIVVLGILAGIVGISYSRQQASSRTDRRIADVKTIASSLDNYYQNNGNYPVTCGMPNTNILHLRGCSGFGDTSAPWYYFKNGMVIVDMIPAGASASTVRNVLPSVTEQLRDPRAPDGSAQINQLSGANIAAFTYYVFSPDIIFASSGGTGTQSFNNPNGGSITCRYTTVGAASPTQALPQQYIIGYYDELQRTWQFGISAHKADIAKLTWEPANSSSSACTPRNIAEL